MKFTKLLKIIKQEFRNYLDDLFSHYPILLTLDEQRILSEIKTNGFYVIPNFYTETECIEVRHEINNLLKKYKDQVQVDQTGSDHRIWGADRISPLIRKFFTNSFVDKIVNAYQKTDNKVGFTLAARLDYKPDNLGSGGGWHRDTAHSKQIKAILYLSLVTKTSGPFQYIKGSHLSLSVIRETFASDFSLNQNRFTNEEIEKLLTKNNLQKLQTFTAKAGTLILVDTRGLHRGMPILESDRFALTNYYWNQELIPSHLAKLLVKQ